MLVDLLLISCSSLDSSENDKNQLRSRRPQAQALEHLEATVEFPRQQHRGSPTAVKSAPHGSYTLRSELSTPGGWDRTERLIVVGGVTRQPEQGGPQLFTPLIHDLKNTVCYIKLSVSAL